MRALALLLLVACGGAPTAGATVAFEATDVARAERAPDLLARAREARERAERAAAEGDDEAAADHATEARLWLRAAVVEADRLELEAARLEAEREEAVVAERLAEARAEHRAQSAAIGRERAAAVAREQMQRAFEHAEARESRQNSSMNPLTAARAFVDRGRLLAAAAKALGAPADAAAELLDALDAAPTTRDPNGALAEALRLHRRALALLGQARAGSPVDAAVVASLVEAAEERGLEVSLTPDGAFLAAGARDTTKVADLLREFPHGPARIAGRGARRLERTLAREDGVAAERLTSDEGAGALTVQLPAYGSAAGLPTE